MDRQHCRFETIRFRLILQPSQRRLGYQTIVGILRIGGAEQTSLREEKEIRVLRKEVDDGKERVTRLRVEIVNRRTPRHVLQKRQRVGAEAQEPPCRSA